MQRGERVSSTTQVPIESKVQRREPATIPLAPAIEQKRRDDEKKQGTSSGISENVKFVGKVVGFLAVGAIGATVLSSILMPDDQQQLMPLRRELEPGIFTSNDKNTVEFLQQLQEFEALDPEEYNQAYTSVVIIVSLMNKPRVKQRFATTLNLADFQKAVGEDNRVQQAIRRMQGVPRATVQQMDALRRLTAEWCEISRHYISQIKIKSRG